MDLDAHFGFSELYPVSDFPKWSALLTCQCGIVSQRCGVGVGVVKSRVREMGADGCGIMSQDDHAIVS